jgi:hypothetical protein
MSLMSRGMAMLARVAPVATGGRISISDGTNAVELDAGFGRSEFEIDTGVDPVRIEQSDRDFLVRAAELVLNGVRTEPRRGLRITVLATGELYDVAAPSNSKVYRKMDPAGTLLRIHTKLIG